MRKLKSIGFLKIQQLRDNMIQELQSKKDLLNQFPDEDFSKTTGEHTVRILRYLTKELAHEMMLLEKTFSYISELEKIHPHFKKRSK